MDFPNVDYFTNATFADIQGDDTVIIEFTETKMVLLDADGSFESKNWSLQIVKGVTKLIKHDMYRIVFKIIEADTNQIMMQRISPEVGDIFVLSRKPKALNITIAGKWSGGIGPPPILGSTHEKNDAIFENVENWQEEFFTFSKDMVIYEFYNQCDTFYFEPPFFYFPSKLKTARGYFEYISVVNDKGDSLIVDLYGIRNNFLEPRVKFKTRRVWVRAD